MFSSAPSSSASRSKVHVFILRVSIVLSLKTPQRIRCPSTKRGVSHHPFSLRWSCTQPLAFTASSFTGVCSLSSLVPRFLLGAVLFGVVAGCALAACLASSCVRLSPSPCAPSCAPWLRRVPRRPCAPCRLFARGVALAGPGAARAAPAPRVLGAPLRLGPVGVRGAAVLPCRLVGPHFGLRCVRGRWPRAVRPLRWRAGLLRRAARRRGGRRVRVLARVPRRAACRCCAAGRPARSRSRLSRSLSRRLSPLSAARGRGPFGDGRSVRLWYRHGQLGRCRGARGWPGLERVPSAGGAGTSPRGDVVTGLQSTVAAGKRSNVCAAAGSRGRRGLFSRSSAAEAVYRVEFELVRGALDQ